MSGFWPVPRLWEGGTVAVLASGPSLDRAQVDTVLASGAGTIVVNRTHELVPEADWLHSSDARFWATYPGARDFRGIKTTTSPPSADDGVHLLGLRRGFDFTDPCCVLDAQNSGIEAICVAALTGASRIVLLGFDGRAVNGAAHWHDDHPEPRPHLRNTPSASNPTRWHFRTWRDPMARLETSLRGRVEVLNATPGSVYECWPKVDLGKALRAGST